MTFDLGPADEELEPDRGGRDRRLRVELLVGAVVLVAVLAAGKALSGRGGGGPSSSASPTATASNRATSIPGPIRAPTTPVVPAPHSVFVTRANGERVLVPALPARTFGDPSACPVDVSCYTEEAVNGSVLDAVRAVFPASKVVSLSTVRLVTNPWAGDLWFRQLTFTTGRGAKLVVRVSAPGAADSPGGGTGSNGMTYYGARQQQYIVYVEMFSREHHALAELRRLAQDSRLLAT